MATGKTGRKEAIGHVCIFKRTDKCYMSFQLFRKFKKISYRICLDPKWEATMNQGILLNLSLEHMVFCFLGIVVSSYAFYIEVKKSKDKTYKAACDINERMSCSRVLTSKYSRGFGIVELLVGKDHYLNLPNCVLGIAFYSLQLMLGFAKSQLAVTMLVITSVVSCIGSVFLAIVLFFILKDVCLVCMATYVINGLLFYLNYQRYSAL